MSCAKICFKKCAGDNLGLDFNAGGLPAEKWTLGDGSTFSWPANEHCMLLIGFDGEYCYLNDPFVGKTVKYDKKLTEKRYCELGKQAVAIK